MPAGARGEIWIGGPALARGYLHRPGLTADRFRPDPFSGEPGARNSFKCAGLEEKMGIHGNATCFMSYDGATGWLLGEEHKGLRQMFVMMNEARLGVAIQGLAQAEAAYQAAVAFAKDRLQGRALTGPQNPEGPADDTYLDTTRLREDTGYRPGYDTGQAVADYLAWLRAGNPR